MKSLTLSRFDPEPSEEDWTRVQVGYDAVLEDGREVHSVTTVYRQQAPSGERAEILAIADAAILPGLILQDRQVLPGLPSVPTPFTPPADELAKDPPAAPPGAPPGGHKHRSDQ